MHLAALLRRQISILLICMLPLTTVAATYPLVSASSEIAAKLDRRLTRIAIATESGDSRSLMGRAISRELFRKNTPQEVRWNAAGQVQVYLHFDRYENPPAESELIALGASKIVVCRELGVVQAWLPADRLYDAAARSDISRITVPRYAFTKRAVQSGPVARIGLNDTVGDSLLGAQSFRTATGDIGQGITVAVISDGDTHAADDFATNDLPNRIWNDPNDAGSFNSSGDEGTAMMEIIYDLAPGVSRLGFCGPQTDVDFVTCLDDFANNINPSVIVDDLGFPGVALFTDGGFATAVKNFAINHPDIQLVTAAGNDASDFWAGTWNPMSVSTTINGVSYTEAQNFGTASAPNPKLQFTVKAGDAVSWVLEWDDPWVDTDAIVKGTTPNIADDYDIVLFDSGGNALACNQGININTTNGSCSYTAPDALDTPGPQPLQGSYWQNEGTTSQTVYLEIFKVAGTPGTNLKLLVDSQSSYDVGLSSSTPADSIMGQSALAFPYEISVGAVVAAGNYPIERYSSRGPVIMEFPSAETRTPKPDVVGPDCVDVTGAGGFPSPFCGTSAAAPHIAGLIALLDSAYPGSSKTPFELLQDGSLKLQDTTGLYPNDTYGYGLPNLVNTLDQDPVPLATSFTIPSGSITTGTAVTFLGGCLADGSANGVSYNWNFGATANPVSSSVQKPSVTFTTAGTYNVTLRCTNNQHLTNTVSHQVTVISAANDKAGTGSGKSGGGGFGLIALGCLMFVKFQGSRSRFKPAVFET